MEVFSVEKSAIPAVKKLPEEQYNEKSLVLDSLYISEKGKLSVQGREDVPTEGLEKRPTLF